MKREKAWYNFYVIKPQVGLDHDVCGLGFSNHGNVPTHVTARSCEYYEWSHCGAGKRPGNEATFNPHPEVGYVNRFTIRIRAFTQIQFSLIRILNRFKRLV